MDSESELETQLYRNIKENFNREEILIEYDHDSNKKRIRMYNNGKDFSYIHVNYDVPLL